MHGYFATYTQHYLRLRLRDEMTEQLIQHVGYS